MIFLARNLHLYGGFSSQPCLICVFLYLFSLSLFDVSIVQVVYIFNGGIVQFNENLFAKTPLGASKLGPLGPLDLSGEMEGMSCEFKELS